MIKSYNHISLAFGIPGLVLQIASQYYEWPAGQELLAPISLLIGTALLLVGLAFYAMAKGRHPAWCLLAFLSILGMIVLGVLKDHAGQDSVSKV